ncbi:PQ loop repeat-domain-containing protein [Cristinia sonorae]|uniref:PQ loop repeat-domain-containing protein n=1 Tax=Cristinia sonorae TaxID=1940300 RepID=A0A8K0UYB9_9AGAR|nr:PQ loop repeat-domain-containing protein [Cristinia sonorae]
MAGPFTVSDVLGYTSITCWLGAQFPQVMENYRRRSVEGLALPFLLNWLLGDISNLIGCILTHQLPFQTYLAIYFCFIDLSLFGQFFYYRKPTKPLTGFRGRSRTTSTAGRRISIERPTRYRTLSHVAANVAAAAALAAQQEETRWQHRSSLEAHRRATTEPHFDPTAAGGSTDDDDVDEQTLSRLADSFHSEGGGRQHRKVVAWSQERRGESLGRHGAVSPTTPRVPANLRMTTSPIIGNAEDFDFSTRGRSVSRSRTEDEAGWATTSAERRSSRASRKGASMVFLGVWALFGIGTLAGSGRGLPSSAALRMGRVMDSDAVIPRTTDIVPPVFAEVPIAVGSVVDESKIEPSPWVSGGPHTSSARDDGNDSTEYLIGRISAWVCTTLYLTSRLPQIWKNFVRKSVEGLSMYLFVFAFLGNFFYVASILLSPKLQQAPAEASAFLRESIPYLLGSGGTLMFDVTIVTQSFIYRPKTLSRGRRPSRTANEEEAGLLSADATGAEEPITPSRRRLQTSTEAGYSGS